MTAEIGCVQRVREKHQRYKPILFWFGAGTGDIIHDFTRKLPLHLFDPTNAILPRLPAEIWETETEKGNDSGFLRFALSGGLLLLDLLLSQGLRQ